MIEHNRNILSVNTALNTQMSVVENALAPYAILKPQDLKNISDKHLRLPKNGDINVGMY